MRPMTQITGHAEFCELFLDDVVVPKENLLGATAATAGRSPCTRSATSAGRPRSRARSSCARGSTAPSPTPPRRAASTTRSCRSQLAQALIGVEVLRHHAYRTVGEFLNGGAVGPDSSSVKLLMAEAEQRLAATRASRSSAPEDEFWTETYLYSRAASVYGGTQQIQRNIIADRILALPQE